MQCYICIFIIPNTFNDGKIPEAQCRRFVGVKNHIEPFIIPHRLYIRVGVHTIHFSLPLNIFQLAPLSNVVRITIKINTRGPFTVLWLRAGLSSWDTNF